LIPPPSLLEVLPLTVLLVSAAVPLLVLRIPPPRLSDIVLPAIDNPPVLKALTPPRPISPPRVVFPLTVPLVKVSVPVLYSAPPCFFAVFWLRVLSGSVILLRLGMPPPLRARLLAIALVVMTSRCRSPVPLMIPPPSPAALLPLRVLPVIR